MIISVKMIKKLPWANYPLIIWKQLLKMFYFKNAETVKFKCKFLRTLSFKAVLSLAQLSLRLYHLK